MPEEQQRIEEQQREEQQRIEDIHRGVSGSLSKYLEHAYPRLADVAKNEIEYMGVATPEAVKKYIPELEGELKPHLEDFGIGDVTGTFGAQKDRAILYSLGGRLNLLDLLTHELGHRAAESSPEWYKTFNAWQYPKDIDRQLTISGYLTAPSFERMRKASEAMKDQLASFGKEPIAPMSEEELGFLDRLAKEEFFLRRALYPDVMGSGPTSYMEEIEKEPNFLSDYVEALPEEDKETINYIANRYREFLKYGSERK